MYICVCKAITEEKLKEVLRSGHQGPEALKVLGVGDSCGICLIEAMARMNAPTKASQSGQ